MRQLAEQLRAAGVPTFPCWAKFDTIKNKWAKGPAVPKGEPWQITALRPVSDPALDWSSGVVGVPVPASVLIIDLDAYKGATREDVEGALGCVLDWEAAFIQRTISGGEHYAFRCSWPARQGDSLAGVQGFDTRAAGKGFVCAGEGYSPVNHGGVLAFGSPGVLPEIPEEARAVLEHKDAPATPRTPGNAPATGEVVDALRHIDPACSRSQWRNVGYAIKAVYKNDDAEGMALFDAWSAGELWDGEAPHNYVESGKGSVEDQWPTFKADGGITPHTLYYYAIQNGWRPPASFDAASAFGPGAAPADAFSDLVARIRRDGGDICNTGDIIAEVQSAGCNALQVALLAAELKTQLTDAGVKDKVVAAHIDGLLRTRPPAEAPSGLYGKNDTDNAAIFLDGHYPDGGLCRCDEEFYAFTGKAWEARTAATIRGQVYSAMAAHRMNESRMSACYRTVMNLVPVRDGLLNADRRRVVLFQNGILDLLTGELLPHDRTLFTTNIMPYDWQPGATCPQWAAFLNDAFSGDTERVQLLREWFGYMMTRDYTWQKIMVLLGGPRSGKGTIGRILSALTGKENFSGGHLSAFANDSFLAGLRTKTVLFIGDAAKRVPSARVNEVTERIKSISGNDEISFDRKFMTSLSETLPTRITIAANSVPQLFDDSGALASRLLLLTFDKSYLGREDLALGDRLHEEVEGIAVWALEGLRALAANGRFTQPAACEHEARDVRESYSPLMRFVAEVCELAPGVTTPGRDVYEAYRAWVVVQQEELLKPRTFATNLKDSFRGRGVWRTDDGAFCGLRIKREQMAFQPKAVG